MKNEITVNGVRGYVDASGNAFLNLEDVARGLGFTQTKAGVEYVRWETVYSYLRDLGFSQLVGKDSFIPESIFYRLAMKAKNAVAEEFQSKVAEEILPAIRKHGGYLTPEKVEEALLNPDTIIRLATELKREREEKERLQLETARQAGVIEEQAERLTYLDEIMRSEGTLTVTQIANDYGLSALRLNALLHEAGIQRKVHGQWVLYAKYHRRGLTKSVTKVSNGRSCTNTHWTQAGRLLIHQTLAEIGIHANQDSGIDPGVLVIRPAAQVERREPTEIKLSLRINA